MIANWTRSYVIYANQSNPTVSIDAEKMINYSYVFYLFIEEVDEKTTKTLFNA